MNTTCGMAVLLFSSRPDFLWAYVSSTCFILEPVFLGHYLVLFSTTSSVFHSEVLFLELFFLFFIFYFLDKNNNRHMERPGGPVLPGAAGGGGSGGFGGVAYQSAEDSIQGGRGRRRASGPGDSSYHAADDSCRPSQVPASARRAAASPSLVNGWLFNAARETAPPSSGPGPVACAYGDRIGVSPSSLPRELNGVGGPSVLFPLLQRAQTEPALCWTIRLIRRAVRGGGAPSLAYMQTGGGYIVLAGLLRSRRELLGPDTVRACFEMAVDRAHGGSGGGGGGDATGNPDSRGVGFEGDDKGGDGDGGGAGGGESGVGGEDQPWGGADKGRGEEEMGAEERRADAWGWEQDVAFIPREEMGALFRKAGVEEEVGGEREGSHGGGVAGGGGGCAGGREGGRQRLSPFVLLTDPYALKNVVMNHQVRPSRGNGCVVIWRLSGGQGEGAREGAVLIPCPSCNEKNGMYLALYPERYVYNPTAWGSSRDDYSIKVRSLCALSTALSKLP